jgi:hypothetical protein
MSPLFVPTNLAKRQFAPHTSSEEVGKGVDQINELELAGEADRRTDLAEQASITAIVGAAFDKVVELGMIAVLRAQLNARLVRSNRFW